MCSDVSVAEVQSIPRVQLQSKANTLLINYAEIEMPHFPASLIGRHRSRILPALPAPLPRAPSPLQFSRTLLGTHHPLRLVASRQMRGSFVSMQQETRQSGPADVWRVALSPEALSPTFGCTRGLGAPFIFAFRYRHWFHFHPSRPAFRGFLLIGGDLR